MKTLSTQLDGDGILTVTIDVKHETMNVLTQQVMQEFSTLTQHIADNHAIKAAIFTSGKSNSFIAGADIKMLQQANTANEGSAIVSETHQLLQTISHSQKPFVAAINGVCLGAGYELALACHYRIASDDANTKIGLPEVMLGLLPGATGTTKLSRLIPLPAALDMMLTGKQLDSKKAKRLGMIDEVVPTNILLHAAKKSALRLVNNNGYKRKKTLSHILMALPIISDIIIKKARQQVIKKTKNCYPAPLAILDVVQYGLHKPLKKALTYEAKRFGELTVTPEAKQLIHLYFATTELKKHSFIDSDTNSDNTPRSFSHIGVLGGGLMGAGIATVCIDKAGVNVRLKDIADKGLLYAHQHLQRYYQAKVKHRILSSEQAKRKINQLTSALDYRGFEKCDVVIEAVFEDLEIKHQMLSDIEALGNEHTIFASNTSSLPITDIANKAHRPENVIGMHYFSPVEKMPLLEIIKHAGTSDQTITTAVALGRKQGKTVIVVNDGAGFYVNRILIPYMNAALKLGLDGVPFNKIDQALTHFGFPVGPIKLLDEVGIDIGSKIIPVLENAFGERMKSCGIHTTLLAKGRLGKKVKKGFYDYQHKKNKRIDPSVYTDLNITPNKTMAEKDIIEYCLQPMLNEAKLCLEEGIIQSARDGDIGAIFGIGFPPFLGGPFRYMEGLTKK